MIPIGRLKSNLQFNKDLGSLIEVMKLAATSQFNQFRLRTPPQDEFLQLLDEIFGALISSGRSSELLIARDNLPTLFLLISSDEGFLGELNFLLVNKLLNSRRPQDIIAVSGAQGINYLKELGLVFSPFESPGEKIDLQMSSNIRDFIFNQYIERKVGKVCVIYSRFLNIASQQIELETLLPLLRSGAVTDKPLPNLLIEPDFEQVICGWIKSWLDFRLFQVFWSAKLAELAARIMHLEGSVQELGKINSRLNMEYFKYLHSLSDKSIRELTAARLIGKED